MADFPDWLSQMLMIEEAVKAFWLRYPGERP